MSIIHLTPPAQKKRIPILIGSGAIRELPAQLEKEQYDRLIMLCDEGVRTIAEGIAEDVGCKTIISVPSGEKSKTLEDVQRLIEELIRAQATRQSILLLVGGGMVTDVGGFVSSIFLRGVRFINIPTSLLCMVDAGIGGKTGVDLAGVKNLIGTLAHPTAVIMDIQMLASLPDSQLHSGIAEVVKMAAMLDAKFFAWLEHHSKEILDHQDAALTACIEKAVQIKVDVVEKDEKECGKRMFLNFGHTVGHALETHSGFALSHGEAVSRGMVAEMAIAGTEDAERITALLTKISMPTTLPKIADAAALWKLMEQDKKTVGDTVRMAVPERIGAGEIRELKKDQFRSICI
ncbi:MAG: 3-dehydroquinate synthase [Candidatus Peribacteraceae bacterium]|jgi:3-dehydroquinate synthase